MSCSQNNLKRCNYKTAQKTYNNNAQTVTTAGITPLLLGNLVTDTGIGVSSNVNNFGINYKGLYYIEADLTATATGSGTFEFSMLKNGFVLPCAISRASVADDSIVTLHIETVLYLKPEDIISFNISGAEGTINFISAEIIKQA